MRYSSLARTETANHISKKIRAIIDAYDNKTISYDDALYMIKTILSNPINRGRIKRLGNYKGTLKSILRPWRIKVFDKMVYDISQRDPNFRF